MTKNTGSLRKSSSNLNMQSPPHRQPSPGCYTCPATRRSERQDHGRIDIADLVDRRLSVSSPVHYVDNDVLLSLPTVPTHVPVLASEKPVSADDAKVDPTKKAASYCKPFCSFLSENPTVYHAVDNMLQDLDKAGYKRLSERASWKLEKGGKYYVERNGSSAIAFAVGDAYEPGNGVAMLAGHVDALSLRLKPIPTLRTTAGYMQLGVAPYAGALNSTWWDRDLGIGGRVLVKEPSGKIVSKLVKLPGAIARIPTLAPHFGAAAYGPFNPETQMVPIVGLDQSESSAAAAQGPDFPIVCLGGAGSFTSTQPPRLVKAVSKVLGVEDYSSIVNWDLEMYDTQPATTGGFDGELLFGGRIDDKICSWAAVQGLINATSSSSSAKSTSSSSIIKLVGLFDNEEIGSLSRQGAHSNFTTTVVERIVESFSSHASSSLVGRTFANSFLVSSDVTHAVNPNFLNAYLQNHSPHLNVGIAIAADSNGHMTTDAISTALFTEVANRTGNKLQLFQIRNDSRSGGTVGPMLSAATGMRAVDAGIPQLSMHSIRATVGSLDPGLGVAMFQAFLEEYEDVDKLFSSNN